MTMSPNDVADLIRDVNTSSEAVEDPRLRAHRVADHTARSACPAELGAVIPKPTLARESGTAWLRRADWNGLDPSAVNESSFASPDGQLCGLFAVDIAGFNGCRRDDDIQIYVHKALYDMLEAAFDKSDVPWFSCAHEDRGDGVLVIVPPMISIAGLLDPVPERLRGLIRRHNRVSCEAARVQLRVALHIGPVHNDGHGWVGRDVTLLCRLLDSRSLKRMLAQSSAEVAFITSCYVYENVICRRPSLVDPALFRRVSVQVKETRTRAWAYVLGALARRRKLGPADEARPPRRNYSWVVTALTSV
jgi:hypothetical protein